MTANHCSRVCTSAPARWLFIHNTTSMASMTMFFQKVAALDSMIASPKHPQSLTGSAIHIYSVSAVMTAMKMAVSLIAMRLKHPRSIMTPAINSAMASAPASSAITLSGSAMCHAPRYSPILYVPPQISTALTHPENMKTAPMMTRNTHTMMAVVRILVGRSIFKMVLVAAIVVSAFR